MRKLNNFLSVVVIATLVLLGLHVADNFYLVNNFTSNVFERLISGDGSFKASNEYSKSLDYSYVQITDIVIVKEKKDVSNIFYTFLDSGIKSYSYKCDASYLNCIQDSKKILEDGEYLSNISNFVHPFNAFNKINTSFTTNGKVTISKEDRYSKEDIIKLNAAVDMIYEDNYNPNDTIENNVKIFHDYIINTNEYDSTNVNGKSIYRSSYATGALFEGYAVCSGYADAMALFLDKIGLQNIRVSSDTHTWNLVNINNTWYHLDLTWDDPVSEDGKNNLSHKYFLITYKKLKSFGDKEQIFDKNIYIEAL